MVAREVGRGDVVQVQLHKAEEGDSGEKKNERNTKVASGERN